MSRKPNIEPWKTNIGAINLDSEDWRLELRMRFRKRPIKSPLIYWLTCQRSGLAAYLCTWDDADARWRLRHPLQDRILYSAYSLHGQLCALQAPRGNHFGVAPRHRSNWATTGFLHGFESPQVLRDPSFSLSPRWEMAGHNFQHVYGLFNLPCAMQCNAIHKGSPLATLGEVHMWWR